ncbi:hypothetical protein OQA88_9122 [Cercophora sp. LCS_1]
MNSRFAKEYVGGQLCIKPEYPTHQFTGQTIIVTGSNTGMGMEAARHFVRLDAAKVILAVRSTAKGEQAAKDIATSTKRDGVAEVWQLDLASYQSVEAFAQRASALPRLDVLVGNAGIFFFDFEIAEDNEAHITVNVVSHMLLTMLLLPKLRETSIATGKPSVVTLVGSFTHWMTSFPERKNDNILDHLNDKTKARMRDRYYVSKLIQLLTAREFAKEVTNSTKPGRVIVSVTNPGFVRTDIMRHGGPLFQIYLKIISAAFARTTEEGARTLVLPAQGDEATHGKYMNDGIIAEPSDWVLSEEGREKQQQLWRELAAKLEQIHPGILGNI